MPQSRHQAPATQTLNHLSFPAPDLEATTAFFEQQLGCVVRRMGAFNFLKHQGFDIVIEDGRLHGVSAVDWPHNFHIGFELPSRLAVVELFERFTAQGVRFTQTLHHAMRGTRFFCEAPGGLVIEVNTREDAQIPLD